jgi:hypothetical protein
MIREKLTEDIFSLVKKYYPEEKPVAIEMSYGSIEIQFLRYQVELLDSGWINILGPDIYWRLEIYDYKDVSHLESNFLEKLEELLKNYEALKLLNRLWNWIKKIVRMSS